MEKLERIGKHLEEEKEMSTDGHISDQESDEEVQENDSEITAYTSGQFKEVANYNMKVFALNTKVTESPLSPKALTRNFQEGNIK